MLKNDPFTNLLTTSIQYKTAQLGINIYLAWVSSHPDFQTNIKADLAAKEALYSSYPTDSSTTWRYDTIHQIRARAVYRKSFILYFAIYKLSKNNQIHSAKKKSTSDLMSNTHRSHHANTQFHLQKRISAGLLSISANTHLRFRISCYSVLNTPLKDCP